MVVQLHEYIIYIYTHVYVCIYKYICIHASWNSKTFEGRIPMDLFTVNSYQNHSSDGKNHVNIKARWLLQAILIFYLGEMIPKFHFKTFFSNNRWRKIEKKLNPGFFHLGNNDSQKDGTPMGGLSASLTLGVHLR